MPGCEALNFEGVAPHLEWNVHSTKGSDDSFALVQSDHIFGNDFTSNDKSIASVSCSSSFIAAAIL